MTKGYQSMKGTMAANTPQDTGSAVKTSGKHYSFKPDDVQQNSLDGGHVSTNYNMGNDGSTMSPHPQ
jgi:D-tyrosyl-tRNA(Tyr) deacylase